MEKLPFRTCKNIYCKQQGSNPKGILYSEEAEAQSRKGTTWGDWWYYPQENDPASQPQHRYHNRHGFLHAENWVLYLGFKSHGRIWVTWPHGGEIGKHVARSSQACSHSPCVLLCSLGRVQQLRPAHPSKPAVQHRGCQAQYGTRQGWWWQWHERWKEINNKIGEEQIRKEKHR